MSYKVKLLHVGIGMAQNRAPWTWPQRNTETPKEPGLSGLAPHAWQYPNLKSTEPLVPPACGRSGAASLLL